MANADAWNSGFGLGKKAAMKGKNTGDRAGLFTKTAASDSPASPDSFKKGGKVKKTGRALVHKGEVVLTKEQAKKYSAKGKKTRKRVASKG